MESEKLKRAVGQLMRDTVNWDNNYLKELPTKWEMHGRCVLFPPQSFQSPIWQANPQVFETVAKVLDVDIVARYAS